MRRILRGQASYRVLLFILCFGLSFFYEAQGQVSGTYTINSAVATGGTNFHSFADAVTFMQSGLNGPIVFNVAPGSGPYNEQVYLNNKIGTTAANTLTFNCNGVTLTFLSTDPNQRAGIKLDNISYVTINNLVVVPQGNDVGQYGYGFHLLNNSDNNTIKNCTVRCTMNYNDRADNNEGVVINGNDGYSTDPGNSNCDNNLIQGNTISGGGNGITLYSNPASGPATIMQGNKILNNIVTDCYASCIQLYNNNGTVVDGNDIQGGPDATNKLMGVYMSGIGTNIKITNNQIHNFHIDDAVCCSFIYGILNTAQGASGSENLIANNLIADFISNAVQFGIATRLGTASYFNVYHNTISLDDQTLTGGSADGLLFTQVNNVNIWNNIVTITRQTDNGNRGVNLNQVTQVTCDRNVFNIDNGNGGNSVGKWNATVIDILPDWQKATGFDYHSVFTDPMYTNLAANQYKPTSKVIDNMGVYKNVNTDITAASRSTTNPDPGCYEFTSAACSTTINPGKVSIITDTVFCVGPSITLNLVSNTWGNGQTYTWQSASSAAGPYTNISANLVWPALDQTPTSTTYYRAVLTCGAATATTPATRVIAYTQLPGGTYTINSTQPTGGINFHSFGDAVLAMQCGINGPIVFNVAPNTGPYNEQVIIPAINTSPTKTITFNCNGDTLSYAPTAATEKAVIKLNGTDYVTIDSLNINVIGTSTAFGIQLMNDADNNTIKRCKILLNTTSGSAGLNGIVFCQSSSVPTYVSGGALLCDSNTIIHDTIIGGSYGITCTSGVSGPASTGNVFSNNSLRDQFNSAIYVDGGVTNMLIDSNDISLATRKAVTKYYAINIDQATTGAGPTAINISRNRIHDLLKNRQDTAAEIHGIHIERIVGMASAPIVVSNNVMYNFYGLGMQYALYTLGSNYVKFYHNTVSLEDSLAKVTDATVRACGFGSFYIASPTTTGVEFKNNSVVVKRAGSGISAGIYINSNDGPLLSNYNNYLMVASKGSTYTGFMNNVTYPLLSDWWNIGKDSNSISLDPLYLDPAHYNFTPTYIPFDNKGTPVGIPKDIINVSRSISKPDIGAYEFTICYPLNTPVLTLDSVGVYTLRFSWTPVTNTTGYLVSRDGVNWSIPSSGPMGTTHTVAGLKARDTVGLIVKALGTRWDCPPVYSNRLTGQTITDQIFIPNTFTPNGNGQNDVFKVYSNIIQTMHLMIFNQWGEKVFETTDPNTGWDGTYKGKQQPVGVYVYVAYMVLSDQTNSTVTKKGTFNLIR